MKALILAAGRGSRLGEYTQDTPKGMVHLGGCSLIQRQINTLKKAGIQEIALVTGYCAQAFDSFPMLKFHNPDWKNTNIVGSLLMAKEWLRNDACLVTYADILYEPELIQRLSLNQSDLLVPINMSWKKLWESRFSNPLEDIESLRLSKDNRIIEIGNKVTFLDSVEGQFMGILQVQPKGWRNIETVLGKLGSQISEQLDMTRLLQILIDQNYPVLSFPTSSQWIEVDTSDDLSLYQDLFLIGKLDTLFPD